jgi:hypothetical protein
MTLHSYPRVQHNHPSITQNEKELLKTTFPRSLPPKLPTLHNIAPYGPMNGVQPSRYTSNSVLHPHDPKHQPCGPPQPLICDQKWDMIIERTSLTFYTNAHINAPQGPMNGG